MLRQILQTAELTGDNPALVWAALSDFDNGSADFTDCLIGHENHAAGCAATFTFDIKAAQSRYFELVG